MLGKLEEIYEEVKVFLTTKGLTKTKTVGKNVKGEEIREFDLLAERIVIEGCTTKFSFPVKILTEEQGWLQTKEGEPKYTFVIDPVDGSTNYQRGIKAVAFSIAVIPAQLSIKLKNVTHALVGSIFTDDVFTAKRDTGAFWNGKRIKTSEVIDPKHAMIVLDYEYKSVSEIKKIEKLLPNIGYFRKLGSCSYELAHLAKGSFDARIDIRNKLSAENFIAASLILREAGGIITNEYGEDFGEIKELKTTYNFIAAGNKILHSKILGLLSH